MSPLIAVHLDYTHLLRSTCRFTTHKHIYSNVSRIKDIIYLLCL